MSTTKARRRFPKAAAVIAVVVALGVTAYFVPFHSVDRKVRRLRTSDPAAREAVVSYLAAFRSQDDIKRLAAHLGDGDARIRDGVIEALARIGEPAINPVIALCGSGIRQRDRSPMLYEIYGALRLLSWVEKFDGSIPITGGHYYLVSARTGYIYHSSRVLLARFGTSAAEPVAGLLNSSEPIVRLFAVRSLAKISDPRSFDVLVAALKDLDWGVREAAGAALFALKKASVKALGDPSLPAETTARWRAYDEKNETAIPPLLNGLNDQWRQVRRSSVLALGCYLSDKAIFDRLYSIAADRNENDEVRCQALGSVSASDDPRVLPLIVASVGDTYISQAALDVMASLPPERRFEAIVSALSSDDRRAYAVLELFYEIHDVSMLEALIVKYRNADAAHKPAMRRALDLVACNRPTSGSESEEDLETINRIQSEAWEEIYGDPASGDAVPRRPEAGN